MNSANYNPGGLTVPLKYHVPTMPYGVPAGAVGRMYLEVLSTVIANFDTKLFTLRRAEADGSFTAVTFQFYVAPTPAPALPIVGINLTGLTTLVQIRNAMAVAISNGGGLKAQVGTTARMTIVQPNPGSQADVGFFGDFNGNTLLAISAAPGWVVAQRIPVLGQYGDTMFWGSNELSVPLRIGKIFGMAPTLSPIVSNGSIAP